MINKNLGELEKDFLNACSIDDLEKIKDYIENKKVDINCQDKEGLTGLHWSHEKETVKYLVKKGIDINIRNDNGEIALNYFKKYNPSGYYDKVVKYLENITKEQKQPSQQFKNKFNKIPGIGPDAPVYTNKNGGNQSYMPYDFTLIKPETLFALANILDRGAKKYGKDNWLKISINEHLNHAIQHILNYQFEEEHDIKHSENDLGHAFCRLMMALYHDIQKNGIKLETIEE